MNLIAHRRIGRSATVGLVLLGVAGLLGLGCVRVALARNHLLSGAEALHAATTVLKQPQSLPQPRSRRLLRKDLLSARADFSAAQSELALEAPILNRLDWLPWIGPRLASAEPASNTAMHATLAAIDLLDGMEPAMAALGSRHRQSSMLGQLGQMLGRGRAHFVDARQQTDLAQQSLSLLPASAGNATLDHLIARAHRDLPALRTSITWLLLAPRLLGTTTPSRYLFVWENPAELRATGGFLGESDFLTMRRGVLTTHFVGRAPPHEISSVLLPLPEALYTNESYWIFCDSNWSPHFSLSARLERWFYGEDTGRWADGVINFLDTSTADILRAVGPVYLPPYRRWIDAANVQNLAQQYVNGKYWGPERSGLPDTQRKQFVKDTMHAILLRLQSLPVSRWPLLAAALVHATDQGNLLLYDRRPAVEAAIQSMGADGGILHPAGDSLYIVDDNRSYSKLNPYVRESAAYAVHILPSLGLQARLTIRYRVLPSPQNLEGYGPAYGQLGTKHDYQDFLRVYVPAGAQLERMDGIDRWAPSPAYGLTQFAGRLMVREGRTKTVTIDYRLPPQVLAMSNFKKYTLSIQRQSGANLSTLAFSLRLPSTMQLRSSTGSGKDFSAHLKLHRLNQLSVVLSGGVSAPGSHGASQQTNPPWRSDPYVPFASMRDVHHPL